MHVGNLIVWEFAAILILTILLAAAKPLGSAAGFPALHFGKGTLLVTL